MLFFASTEPPHAISGIKIFVASPGDLERERELVFKVIRELSEQWIDKFDICLRPVGWENATHSAVGDDAQSIINDQIGSNYEIFLGMMWQKIGTKTKSADSGTIEEFEIALKNHRNNLKPKQIMFYFKKTTLNTKEVRRVKKFRKRLMQEVVYFREFTADMDFEQFMRFQIYLAVFNSLRFVRTALKLGASQQSNYAGVYKIFVQRNIDIIADSAKMMERHVGVTSVAIRSLTEFIDTDSDISKKKDYFNIIAADISILSSRIRIEIEVFSDAFTKYVEAASNQVWLMGRIGKLNEFNEYNTKWIRQIKATLRMLIASSTGFQKTINKIEVVQT